jgi:lipopolysaccharide export LptBFGC system permease protein LptF
MISLFKRFVIIVTIVVSITDAVVFYKLWETPELLTIQFVILVIIVTIVPIVINLWYWLVLKQRGERK